MNLPAVHPGEALLEELIERDWSPGQLARLIGCDLVTIQNLLRADEAVTSELAARIELATDVPASFWTNLQADYDRKYQAITLTCDHP